MRNIAVILAGGTGTRLNADIPKQFLKVAGKTVIEHTISVFQNHTLIDEIAVVVSDVYRNVIEEFVIKNGFTKVKRILQSGNERHFSSLSAISAYADEHDCNLIFHDAVRPLLSSRIIDDVVESLKTYSAVDVAIDSADTIIRVNNNNVIESVPPRKMLRRGQTPQGFHLQVIKKAYEIALKDPDFVTTDDCGVVLKYLPEEKIFVVKGEDANMKLTYKEDFYLIEKLFQLHTSDFADKHVNETEKQQLKNKVVVIYGSSSGIGKELLNFLKGCGSKVYGFSRSMNGIDICNPELVKKSLNEVFKKEKRIDYVINTASILQKIPLAHMSYNEIYSGIDVNYRGMVNVAKESFEFLKQSCGQLMFYTSSSYTRGRMNYSIYSSTKCATVNFVQALAEEWSVFNIRVNCINPERTKTPMRTKNFGVEPEGTLLDPADVARVSAKVLLSQLSGQVVDIKLKSI